MTRVFKQRCGVCNELYKVTPDDIGMCEACLIVLNPKLIVVDILGKPIVSYARKILPNCVDKPVCIKPSKDGSQ